MAATPGTSSPRAAPIGLPLSSVSSVPSSSLCSSTSSASFHSSRPRSSGDVLPHSPSSAFRADATARSTSSSPAACTSANGSPVAGFSEVIVSPDSASTYSLSIQRPLVLPSRNPRTLSGMPVAIATPHSSPRGRRERHRRARERSGATPCRCVLRGAAAHRGRGLLALGLEIHDDVRQRQVEALLGPTHDPLLEPVGAALRVRRDDDLV